MKKTRTITTIFMVPTLKIPKASMKDKVIGFIDAFSKDGHRITQFDFCIYLLFKPKDLQKFRQFIDSEYKRTPAIIDHYEYCGNFHVLVYRLSDKYSWDFQMVRKGKYSRTTLEFQKLFSSTVTVMVNFYEKEEVSLQYRVFNKTEDLVKFWEDALDVKFDKEQEIWYSFEDKFETLDLKRIKLLEKSQI